MLVSNDKHEIGDVKAKENVLTGSGAVGFQPEQEQGKQEERSKTQDKFEDFTGYTTLHGLRFIGDHTSVLPRRCLWLLLVLMCGTLFTLQVYDRVSYFMESPITVNFKVNYNKTVAFPAVTICNQNNFRVSKAYKSKWLQYIIGLYGNDKETLHLLPSTTNESLNLPISELFEGLSHSKEDFIVKCQWENEECSPANFTTTLTSHGVCYTFNKASEPDDILQVQNSGVDHGLRLTLNTEQYEVTAGPHDTTGIKMIATDQSDTPLVDQIGLAISTGTHAFVAIGAVTINNLPPPHGECVKSSLTSTERYSPESCLLECETNYVVSKCGCRHFYMPNPKNKTRLCTVAEYVFCLQDAVKSFNDIGDTCDCPASCYYHIYEPTVSYAASSHFKSVLKDDVKEDTFKDRFYGAKEITGKLDFDAEKQFKESFEKSFVGLGVLNSAILNFKSSIASHSHLLHDTNANTKDAIQKRNMLFDFESFIVQKNFLRGRDAMEEKAFGMACQGFNEFVMDIEYKLYYLITNNDVNSTKGMIMYVLLMGSLRSRVDTLALARENYTQLVDAYENGTFILNYTYKDYDWEEHLAIVPKKLLSEALTNDDVKAGSYLTLDDIDRITDSVLHYEMYINTVFGNESFEYNQEIIKIKKLSNEFIQACENFLGKKSTLYNEVIETPFRILNTQQEQFTKLINEYDSIYEKLLNNLMSMNDSIDDMEMFIIPSLKEAFLYGMRYIMNGLDGSESKYDVAMRFTNDRFSNDVNKLERILEDIKRRATETSEAWPSWENKINEIWTFILEDEDIKAYANLKEWEKFQQSVDYRSSEIRHAIGFLSVEYKRTVTRFGEFDHLVIQTIKAIMSDLTRYKEGHDMNEDFYRENFLQVDIYFKELRSEQIDQQIAYDEIALLCDIGGAMGLFIGGSVITFFEIIDFFCLFLVHKLFRRRRV